MLKNKFLDVPEGILVEMTANNGVQQALFEETAVVDVNEMKDLVDGYSTQNKFMNNEVISKIYY